MTESRIPNHISLLCRWSIKSGDPRSIKNRFEFQRGYKSRIDWLGLGWLGLDWLIFVRKQINVTLANSNRWEVGKYVVTHEKYKLYARLLLEHMICSSARVVFFGKKYFLEFSWFLKNRMKMKIEKVKKICEKSRKYFHKNMPSITRI